MSSAAAARQTARDKNLELVAAMGSTKGYDPMPPDQYLCFQDYDFRLTPTAHRALAWMRAKTLRAKPGGRTHFAKDARGELTLTHMADDLGLNLPTASAVFDELEENGLAKREGETNRPGRRLILWSQPQYDPKRKGETLSGTDNNEAETLSGTNKLPAKLRPYFQQLDEKRRPQYERAYFELQAYRRKIVADAVAIAREEGQKLEDSFLSAIGFEHEETRGRKKEPTPRVVTLTAAEPPALLVQITSNHVDTEDVQITSAILYSPESDPVQETTSSICQIRQSKRVSKYETEPPAAPESEVREDLPTPPQEAHFEETETEPAVAAIEEYFGQIPQESPLRAQAAALAGEFGIPKACVALAIHAKMSEKIAASYPVTSPGALLKFTREGLPGWIRQHEREIEARRKFEESTPPAAEAPPGEGADAATLDRIEQMRSELRGGLKA